MSNRSSFKLGYIPSLDGLRGISILAVMAFHANPSLATGGFIGVDVFFVLSGFLITTLLLQEWHSTGTVSLKNFYFRRALRLLPALLLLLAACCLYAAFFLSPADALVNYKASLICLFYMANWVQAFYTTATMGLLKHMWSLSVEEQFYFIWPVLLMTLLSLRLKRRWIVGLVLCGIAAAALHRAMLWDGLQTVVRLYNGLDTRADALLAGCAVGLLAAWDMLPKAVWSRAIVKVCAFASLPVLALLTLFGSNQSPYMYLGMFTFVTVATANIVVMVLCEPPRFVLRILESPRLVFLGRISYGLYLWHYPVFKIIEPLPLPPLVHPFFQFTATVVCASLSFYYVEKPFLRLKDRFHTAPHTATDVPRPRRERRLAVES